MSTLFEFLPIGAFRTSLAGRFLRANAALVRMVGYANECALLDDINDVATQWYVQPGRRAEFQRQLQAQSFVVGFVSEIHRPPIGDRIWVREAVHAVYDNDGVLQYYEGTVEDVTESHLAQLALLENEQRWKLALESAGDGVWDWHVQTGIEVLSRRCKEIYGFAEHEIPDRADALDGRTHPLDLAQMQRDRDDHFAGRTPTYRNEHRILCKDNSWKWVLTRGMVISRDAQGRPLRMIGTHTDISEQKRSEALIWQQAHVDSLTGLPNRRRLRQRLDAYLSNAAVDTAFAVLFIDLDHFKDVNDTLGHDAGDQLLQLAARRIQECVAATDTVARMGGDEFTVLLARDANAVPIETVLARMLAALAATFELDGQAVFVSASIGVALFPEHAQRADILLKHADQALYVAKGAGRNQHAVFTPALQQAAQLRSALAADLRTGLDHDQFTLAYQPIVHLASARVRKAEALLRWQHPTRGAVSPAQFIPIAESTGQIIRIGDWVFRQALQQVAQWRQTLDAQFQISVNVSPVQFHQWISSQNPWCAHLNVQGLPGNCLALEVTEGLLLQTGEQVQLQLEQLRAQGCAISLDDFGTGYSSLTYLQKFALDFIKIDQSFVRHLHASTRDLALCRSIIHLAHDLGLTVVAEGVETEQQRDLLQECGCDYAQGYLFSPPLSAAAFAAYVGPATP